MNSIPKFLVGEPVERIMDGEIGKVVRIYEWDGGWAYAVDLGREPMEGFTDDVWSGSEGAWRHVRRTHAHVTIRSADCDGTYERGYTDIPNALERTEEFGDLNFKDRVLTSVVSLHGEGRLSVTPYEMTWEQPTEEGYIHTEVEWCDREDCTTAPYQRDFRAESMGY